MNSLIGENKIRCFVAVTWLSCFILMWIIFTLTLPRKEFTICLNQIEESAVNKDWDKAKKSMEQLKNIYKSKRSMIQMNNATEILTTFDLTMGQLEAAVENEQGAAVEYAGALKSTLDFVLKAFSGP